MHYLAYALQNNVEIIQKWHEGNLLFKHCIDKLMIDLTQKDSQNDDLVYILRYAHSTHNITDQEYCLGLYDLLTFYN
jgi:hypothetical protein